MTQPFTPRFCAHRSQPYTDNDKNTPFTKRPGQCQTLLIPTRSEEYEVLDATGNVTISFQKHVLCKEHLYKLIKEVEFMIPQWLTRQFGAVGQSNQEWFAEEIRKEEVERWREAVREAEEKGGPTPFTPWHMRVEFGGK